MAKVYRVRLSSGAVAWAFVCPGCGNEHSMRVNGPQKPGWEFDGNVENPTFKPSILMMTGPYPDGMARVGQTDVCHSFVREGQIQFLSDCTHARKNSTMELPDISEDVLKMHEARWKESDHG